MVLVAYIWFAFPELPAVNCGADNSVRRGIAERIQKAKKRSSLGLGVSRAISLQLENGLIIVLQLIS